LRFRVRQIGGGSDKALCSKGTCAGRDPSLGQLKKPKLLLPQALSSTLIKMIEQDTKSKKSEQNEEKFYAKSMNKNYRPLSGFHTGEFIRFSDR
jgi:hypothetical protein